MCCKCEGTFPAVKMGIVKVNGKYKFYCGHCYKERTEKTNYDCFFAWEYKKIKKCSVCNKKLPATEMYFKYNIGGEYGLTAKCIECLAADTKKTHHTRKAREKKAESSYTQKDWVETKENFNNSCAYCGATHKALAQDHVKPLTKGGDYTKKNIVPACRNCNSSKSDSDMEKWFTKKTFFNIGRLNKIASWTSSN